MQGHSKQESQQVMPKDETTIKDVRNIHLSSDHQRAYVWVITYTKSPGSVVLSAD